MDAKTKANFINSVAAGTSIACPKCGANNKSDSKFCISCGAEIVVPKADDAPAFAPTQEASATPAKVAKYVEPQSAFAEGLPAWSIEPPQVMVRRR